MNSAHQTIGDLKFVSQSMVLMMALLEFRRPGETRGFVGSTKRIRA
ncbi:MAG: hypothetical protein CM15mP6_0010 [Methanobacteriota archaeon]|nr:MAG: hypothetical protein CM15mP6_0010 [Euryarchaeota archaeon]